MNPDVKIKEELNYESDSNNAIDYRITVPKKDTEITSVQVKKEPEPEDHRPEGFDAENEEGFDPREFVSSELDIKEEDPDPKTTYFQSLQLSHHFKVNELIRPQVPQERPTNLVLPERFHQNVFPVQPEADVSLEPKPKKARKKVTSIREYKVPLENFVPKVASKATLMQFANSEQQKETPAKKPKQKKTSETPEKDDQDGEDFVFCTVCHKGFKNNRSYKKHWKIHSEVFFILSKLFVNFYLFNSSGETIFLQ
jgi:hypothetical protein